MPNKLPAILLVEDEPSLITLYKAVLKGNYKLSIAENYEQAKEFLAKNKPQLILLDVIIPTVSGSNLDYSKKIGFDILENYKDIPIIVLTNLDSPEDRRIAKKLGAKDFVVKANVLPSELTKKVDKVLGA